MTFGWTIGEEVLRQRPFPAIVKSIHSNISWTVDQVPSEACRDGLDPSDPANEAWLNTVAFGNAKTIIIVPNRYDTGDGPSIRVPAGATILEVLTLIADEYQRKPMTEEELDLEVERCGLDATYEAWGRCVGGQVVHRIEIMGCGIFFEGFHPTKEPDVLRLSLGS